MEIEYASKKTFLEAAPVVPIWVVPNDFERTAVDFVASVSEVDVGTYGAVGTTNAIANDIKAKHLFGGGGAGGGVASDVSLSPAANAKSGKSEDSVPLLDHDHAHAAPAPGVSTGARGSAVNRRQSLRRRASYDAGEGKLKEKESDFQVASMPTRRRSISVATEFEQGKLSNDLDIGGKVISSGGGVHGKGNGPAFADGGKRSVSNGNEAEEPVLIQTPLPSQAAKASEPQRSVSKDESNDGMIKTVNSTQVPENMTYHVALAAEQVYSESASSPVETVKIDG